MVCVTSQHFSLNSLFGSKVAAAAAAGSHSASRRQSLNGGGSGGGIGKLLLLPSSKAMGPSAAAGAPSPKRPSAMPPRGLSVDHSHPTSAALALDEEGRLLAMQVGQVALPRGWFRV